MGTEHSHWSVFDSCQNISIIAYLFYLSFVLGIPVGGLMLRLKAKEFCDDPAFKASVGWYINWKRRHSITTRTKTTLAQRLPNDLKEQTVKFHQFVIAARQRRGYPLSRIFNMDETPMRFEMPSSRTLEFSGSRTVPVKSCGTEKRRKKRRSKLDKAVLEGDPGGDGEEIIFYLRHLQCP